MQSFTMHHKNIGLENEDVKETVIFLQKKKFTMDFCLCGAILDLTAFCFGAVPDIMIELIVYRVYLLHGPWGTEPEVS